MKKAKNWRLKPDTLLIASNGSSSWRIEDRIGRGRYSDVFLALDTQTRKMVAVKVDKEEVRRSAEKGILLKESTIMQKLGDSPYTCSHISFGRLKETQVQGGAYFLVMELCQRKNVSDWRKEQNAGYFGPQMGALVGLEMLKALRFFHEKGYVHRDIKPSNFVLPKKPHWWYHCYIVDFGLAKEYRDSKGNLLPPKDSSEFLGTSLYASIAAHKKKDLGRFDDLWSLLFVIFDFISGRLPWKELYMEMGNRPTNERRSKIFPIKEEFCAKDGEGVHSEIIQYMRELRRLTFESDPPYDRLQQLLEAMGRNPKYTTEQKEVQNSPKKIRVCSIPRYPPIPKVRHPICLELLRKGECAGCQYFHPTPPEGTIQYGDPLELCYDFIEGNCSSGDPPGTKCGIGYHWTENEEQHYRHTGCLPARAMDDEDDDTQMPCENQLLTRCPNKDHQCPAFHVKTVFNTSPVFSDPEPVSRWSQRAINAYRIFGLVPDSLPKRLDVTKDVVDQMHPTAQYYLETILDTQEDGVRRTDFLSPEVMKALHNCTVFSMWKVVNELSEIQEENLNLRIKTMCDIIERKAREDKATLDDRRKTAIGADDSKVWAYYKPPNLEDLEPGNLIRPQTEKKFPALDGAGMDYSMLDPKVTEALENIQRHARNKRLHDSIPHLAELPTEDAVEVLTNFATLDLRKYASLTSELQRRIKRQKELIRKRDDELFKKKRAEEEREKMRDLEKEKKRKQANLFLDTIQNDMVRRTTGSDRSEQSIKKRKRIPAADREHSATEPLQHSSKHHAKKMQRHKVRVKESSHSNEPHNRDKRSKKARKRKSHDSSSTTDYSVLKSPKLQSYKNSRSSHSRPKPTFPPVSLSTLSSSHRNKLTTISQRKSIQKRDKHELTAKEYYCRKCSGNGRPTSMGDKVKKWTNTLYCRSCGARNSPLTPSVKRGLSKSLTSPSRQKVQSSSSSSESSDENAIIMALSAREKVSKRKANCEPAARSPAKKKRRVLVTKGKGSVPSSGPDVLIEHPVLIKTLSSKEISGESSSSEDEIIPQVRLLTKRSNRRKLDSDSDSSPRKGSKQLFASLQTKAPVFEKQKFKPSFTPIVAHTLGESARPSVDESSSVSSEEEEFAIPMLPNKALSRIEAVKAPSSKASTLNVADRESKKSSPIIGVSSATELTSTPEKVSEGKKLKQSKASSQIVSTKPARRSSRLVAQRSEKKEDTSSSSEDDGDPILPKAKSRSKTPSPQQPKLTAPRGRKVNPKRKQIIQKRSKTRVMKSKQTSNNSLYQKDRIVALEYYKNTKKFIGDSREQHCYLCGNPEALKRCDYCAHSYHVSCLNSPSSQEEVVPYICPACTEKAVSEQRKPTIKSSKPSSPGPRSAPSSSPTADPSDRASLSAKSFVLTLKRIKHRTRRKRCEFVEIRESMLHMDSYFLEHHTDLINPHVPKTSQSYINH